MLLFPSLCLHCGRLSEPLCSRCRSALIFRPHLRLIEGLTVLSCMDYACGENGRLLEKLIHSFKYQHHVDASRYFAPLLQETLRLFFDPQEVILVPVPLFIQRERDRGYNQARILAEWAATGTGACVDDILFRVRATAQQARLATRGERRANVHDAFRTLARPPNLKNCRIVIVDDIVTSGSTLLACQKAFMDAGYLHVSALTLADRVLESDRMDCSFDSSSLHDLPHEIETPARH